MISIIPACYGPRGVADVCSNKKRWDTPAIAEQESVYVISRGRLLWRPRLRGGFGD